MDHERNGEQEPRRSPSEEPARFEDGAGSAPSAADEAVLKESGRHTRRSFVYAGLATTAAAGFYAYLNVANQAGTAMQPPPLRRAYGLNAAVSRAVFGERAMAPTYPMERAGALRVNGVYGLKMPLVADSWRLQVVGSRDADQHPRFSPDVTSWEYRYSSQDVREDRGHDTKVAPGIQTAEKMAPEAMLQKAQADEGRAGPRRRGLEESGESYSTLKAGTPGLLLTMDDIRKLPRHELVTEFKCIEGWSQIVQWAGVRMSDFLEAFPPVMTRGRDPRYVYMETPDGDYYTGYDMDVMRHPQTLLVTEMMGAPLTQFHGAPLRLHMPTKYGYKQIKRIGLIAYTDQKPDDYWTKLGYDWYAGL